MCPESHKDRDRWEPDSAPGDRLVDLEQGGSSSASSPAMAPRLLQRGMLSIGYSQTDVKCEQH